MVRSVLAVLAGIVVLTLTSFAIEWLTNPLMMRMLDLPSEAALNRSAPAKLIMAVYTMFCVAAGGYVTASLAPGPGERHAVVMGAIQVGLGAAAMGQFFDHAPLWYWIASLALLIPVAWCGGMIAAKRKGEHAPAKNVLADVPSD